MPVVARVEKWGKYFQVWLSTQYGLLRTFARYDNGRWYLSEPYPGELGDRLTQEYAGVKLHYYAAEADLATAIALTSQRS